jgi:hypothetical protein
MYEQGDGEPEMLKPQPEITGLGASKSLTT